MLNAIKRKFAATKRNDQDELTIKRPRPSSREEGTFVTRIGRRITSFVAQLRSPNFRRAAASRLFNTPEERRSIRYEITPARPLESTCQWRDHHYIFGDKVPITENKNYEFKTGGGKYPITVLPEHIRKYGSAFLNSEGGVLLAGILDDGIIRGIVCKEYNKRNIISTIEREFNKFLPKVDQSLYSITFVKVAERGRHGVEILRDRYVLEVLVRPGNPGEIYEDAKHQVYIRREGSVEGPLSPLQIKDIVIQKYRTIINKRREEQRELQDNPRKEESRRVIVISP